MIVGGASGTRSITCVGHWLEKKVFGLFFGFRFVFCLTSFHFNSLLLTTIYVKLLLLALFYVATSTPSFGSYYFILLKLTSFDSYVLHSFHFFHSFCSFTSSLSLSFVYYTKDHSTLAGPHPRTYQTIVQCHRCSSYRCPYLAYSYL